MNIQVFDIEQIKPYENNPRNNEKAIDKVAESIKQFGFKQPIVIDKNNVIVAGHTRYLAAKQLDFVRVPCIVADDLTEEQIKAYRLADNKVAEFSEWDFDLLNEELAALDDFDMSDFGFEVNEVTFTEEFNDDFEHEIDNLGQRGEANTLARVGEYRFNLTRDEYLSLIEDVQLTAGFTNDEIINELKSRLLKCN